MAVVCIPGYLLLLLLLLCGTLLLYVPKFAFPDSVIARMKLRHPGGKPEILPRKTKKIR